MKKFLLVVTISIIIQIMAFSGQTWKPNFCLLAQKISNDLNDIYKEAVKYEMASQEFLNEIEKVMRDINDKKGIHNLSLIEKEFEVLSTGILSDKYSGESLKEKTTELQLKLKNNEINDFKVVFDELLNKITLGDSTKKNDNDDEIVLFAISEKNKKLFLDFYKTRIPDLNQTIPNYEKKCNDAVQKLLKLIEEGKKYKQASSYVVSKLAEITKITYNP